MSLILKDAGCPHRNKTLGLDFTGEAGRETLTAV